MDAIKIIQKLAEKKGFKVLTGEELDDFSYVKCGIPQLDQLGGVRRGGFTVRFGNPGAGKCLGEGTPVLLYTGEIVPVEKIRSGDKLIGPDGLPRNVLSTSTGIGPLFKIIPVKGEPWICNNVHVLTLVHSGTSRIFDIPLDKYLTENKTLRERSKLFSVGIQNFGEEKELPIDPYFLGAWFGDGTKEKTRVNEVTVLGHIALSKPDKEIEALCLSVAKQWGLKVRTTISSSGCPTHNISDVRHGPSPTKLLSTMRVLLGENLCIPNMYQRASRKNRLEFLAGFLDTDGYLHSKCFEIVQKRKDYADAIAFISRSLGFRAIQSTKTVKCQTGVFGIYHVVSISGDTDLIPTRIHRKKALKRKQVKNVLRTGFTVEPIGKGKYYGFTLDGDGRFLLGDFTVTHNTTLSCRYMTWAQKQWPDQVVLVADAELKFDIKWAKIQGVDPARLIVLRNLGTLEDYLDAFLAVVKTGTLSYASIDSISAMTPREVLEKSSGEEKSIGDMQIAANAKKIQQFISMSKEEIFKHNVACEIIAQVRTHGIGGQVTYDDFSGGHMIRHLSTQIWKGDRMGKSTWTVEKIMIRGKPVEITKTFPTRWTLVKDTGPNESKKAIIDFNIGIGFDDFEAALRAALTSGVIIQGGGGNYTFTLEGKDFKIRGWDSVVTFFKEDKEAYDKLITSVSATAPPDEGVVDAPSEEEEGG